jgi:hypothetical protein
MAFPLGTKTVKRLPAATLKFSAWELAALEKGLERAIETGAVAKESGERLLAKLAAAKFK